MTTVDRYDDDDNDDDGKNRPLYKQIVQLFENVTQLE